MLDASRYYGKSTDRPRNEGLASSLTAEPIPDTRSYKRSNAYLPQAECGALAAQTFSKPHSTPRRQAPLFVTHGDAGRIWDVDGNEYVDLINGLLANLLGYNDPDVSEAVEAQLREGVSYSGNRSRPSLPNACAK